MAKEVKLGQSGYTKKCKCGHLKDEHFHSGGNIYCSHDDCDCSIILE